MRRAAAIFDVMRTCRTCRWRTVDEVLDSRVACPTCRPRAQALRAELQWPETHVSQMLRDMRDTLY